MEQPVLVAQHLTKRFPQNGVVAVCDVSVSFAPRCVTGLVGDNGAGKSTLMHVLSGSIAFDSGRMILRETPYLPNSTHDALAAGVVMAHQAPQFAQSLPVWQNLILGMEPTTRLGMIDRRGALEMIAAVADERMRRLVDLTVDELSSGERRIIALLVALLRLPHTHCGILILDEPTAACTPSETELILQTVRQAAEAGHAVILVSHKLEHVAAVADRVLVMRRGAITAQLHGPVTAAAIAAHVLPPDTAAVGTAAGPHTRVPATGTPRLVVEALAGRHFGGALESVDFAVAGGSILAVTGARDQGILALEEILAGANTPEAGRVLLDGRDITHSPPAERRRLGLGYVPTDRFQRGSVLDASVAENLIVLEREQLDRLGFVDRAQVRTYARRLIEQFAINARPEAQLSELSGGNAQKVVLSREIARLPRALVVCEPSWGLDLESKRLVYDALRALSASGSAVLVLTTELDEVFEIADRVAVLQAGRITLEKPITETSVSEIASVETGAGGRQ